MSIHPAHAHKLSLGTQRLEVMFADGTHLTLRPVVDNGTPDKYLRALGLPAGMVLVFDVRDLVPRIGEDICTAAPRDVPGIVFFSLRHRFATAELCVRQICEHGRPLVQQLEAA